MVHVTDFSTMQLLVEIRLDLCDWFVSVVYSMLLFFLSSLDAWESFNTVLIKLVLTTWGKFAMLMFLFSHLDFHVTFGILGFGFLKLGIFWFELLEQL